MIHKYYIVIQQLITMINSMLSILNIHLYIKYAIRDLHAWYALHISDTLF